MELSVRIGLLGPDLVLDALRRALPVAAKVLRRRAVGDGAQHVGELPTQPHVASVLLQGDHGHVPVQVLHREAVVNADVRALGAGEEALDPVGVGPILGLVGLAVVHPLEDRQPDEIVI